MLKGMDSLTVTDWHSEALCKYFCHNIILVQQADEKRAVLPESHVAVLRCIRGPSFESGLVLHPTS